MQKKVFGRKFSRGRKARTAMFRALTRAVILNGKMTTTKAKAKAVQGSLEKFITWAKEGSVAGRRKVLSEMGNDREAVDKLFGPVAKLFKSRSGGYTKITYLPRRMGDAAEMARIEWTEAVQDKVQEKKNKTEKATSAKPEKKFK
jgi:large subunit ribosomal protein L17